MAGGTRTDNERRILAALDGHQQTALADLLRELLISLDDTAVEK